MELDNIPILSNSLPDANCYLRRRCCCPSPIFLASWERATA